MNINYKESQIDFFSHVSGKSDQPPQPRYMAAQVSLSLENLVICAILAIMVVIFSFSLGIERGKRVALAETGGISAEAKAPVAVPLKSAGRNDKMPQKAEAGENKTDAQKTKPPAVLSRVTMASAGAASEKSGYTLQVASYKGIKSAQREVERLKQTGFDAYVRPSGAYMIVCIGNFQDKEGASGLRRQLKGRYQGTQVRRL